MCIRDRPIIEKTEIPNIPINTVEELEVVNLENEDKLERSRKKRNFSPPPLPPMPVPSAESLIVENTEDVPPPMPPLPLGNVEAADGTKLAKKLVITSDAQSEMESEIEDFVDQRRSRQAEIRSSLERKRRMALAERRAAKARLWTEVEDGEDLSLIHI